MAKPKQKLIITTEIGEDGNIAVSLDFFPALPTMDHYRKMSVEKQGLVAIINQFAKNTQAFVNKLGGADGVPLREAVSDTNSGGETPPQLPDAVPEEKIANTQQG